MHHLALSKGDEGAGAGESVCACGGMREGGMVGTGCTCFAARDSNDSLSFGVELGGNRD